MKDFIDKISSYNLFNYLFPGVLYVALMDWITDVHLVQENIVIGLFLYYFIGMIISRFGSLVIEPLFLKSKIITYEKYADFVIASHKDGKINLLSEVNNTYRTLVALIFLIILSAIFSSLIDYFSIAHNLVIYTLIVALLMLFVFSYRKQTRYISKRIKANIKREQND